MENEKHAKSNTWGGRRAGAGRPKKDQEPKTNITFSVPTPIAELVKQIVRAEVARYRSERDGGRD